MRRVPLTPKRSLLVSVGSIHDSWPKCQVSNPGYGLKRLEVRSGELGMKVGFGYEAVPGRDVACVLTRPGTRDPDGQRISDQDQINGLVPLVRKWAEAPADARLTLDCPMLLRQRILAAAHESTKRPATLRASTSRESNWVGPSGVREVARRAAWFDPRQGQHEWLGCPGRSVG